MDHITLADLRCVDCVDMMQFRSKIIVDQGYDNVKLRSQFEIEAEREAVSREDGHYTYFEKIDRALSGYKAN